MYKITMNPDLRINFYFPLIIALLPGVGSAQHILQGTIFDRQGNSPLAGATISLSGSMEGTFADEDGKFYLHTSEAGPWTIVVSFLGFSSREVIVSDPGKPLLIRLEPETYTSDAIEVKGMRISDKQKASPLTVESLDGLAIREAATDNFYDALGSLKGVDINAPTLAFKIVNTRGFNSTSPVRTLQLIDGVDNQSPGLNFSLGNFLGSPELDVNRVELIQGASSAFYGPNAFNGVIRMETRDPFIHKGLSIMLKYGERNLVDLAGRWASVFRNKDKDEVLAIKVNAAYLGADDWRAENDDPVAESVVDASNPGRYNAVNTYGDEYYPGNDYSDFELWAYPGLGVFYRTGYRETDLVDYDTRNIKLNAALHWRLQPQKDLESQELILASNYGIGTTVYQGENRFSLRNIQFWQNRLEWRKKGKFYLRAYTTHENAGDSYDPFLTAIKLQTLAKSDEIWSNDYSRYWRNSINPLIINDPGYPKIENCLNPITGLIFPCFDSEAAQEWLDGHQEELTTWHKQTESKANMGSEKPTVDYFEPGTPRFEEAFQDLVGKKRTEDGTLFYDHSSLYHIQGEYIFTPTFTDEWLVGAASRLYRPDSEGTVFSDTAGTRISNFEYGFYSGLTKTLFGQTTTVRLTARLDKNQNYDFLFSPAASLVYKFREHTFLRFSYSSAIRNPTLTDQYLLLDVGPALLSGNLEGASDLVTLESLEKYLQTQDRSALEYFNIDPIRPERVQTFELGIRSSLFGFIYVDAGYYYNTYHDFIGYRLGADITIDPGSGLLSDLQIYRYSANSSHTVTTQGFDVGINIYFGKFFMASGNYSYNQLIKADPEDPVIPAFNTPAHKFNLGISGRDIPLRLGNSRLNGLGFNIQYKWIQGFEFEGSPQFTGPISTYGLLDAQVNYQFDKAGFTLKIGASNLLDNNAYQTYGGPRIGRLAYVSLLYELKN